MRPRNCAAGTSRFLVVMVAGLSLAAGVSGVLLHDATSFAEARAAFGRTQDVASDATAKAQIRVEAVPTLRQGATGLPVVASGTGTRNAASIGQTLTYVLGAGTERNPDLCIAGIGTSPAAHLVTWKLEITTVAIGVDRTTIQVHWTRSRAGGAASSVEKDEVRTITLGQGESHVLDYVENIPADPLPPCASLLVKISAQPLRPPDSRSIVFDMWTVDEVQGGETRAVHERVEGPVGQPISFRLKPLDFVVRGAAATGLPPVQVAVSGTIQALVSESGLVDVSVSASRRASLPGGTTGGQGRVQFRSAVGETAEILVPQPGGRLQGIDLAPTFSGHHLSLYVRVESVR